MKSINSKINLLIIMSALTGCWGGGRGGWNSSLATLTENQNLQPTTHELIDVVGSYDADDIYSDSISLDVMAAYYSPYYSDIGEQNGYNTYRGLPTTLSFAPLPKNEDNVEGVSAYVNFNKATYSTTEIIDNKNGTFSLILNDTTSGSNKAFNVLLGTDTIKEIGGGKNLADYALWQYGEIVDGKFVPDNDSYYEGAYATLHVPSYDDVKYGFAMNGDFYRIDEIINSPEFTGKTHAIKISASGNTNLSGNAKLKLNGDGKDPFQYNLTLDFDNWHKLELSNNNRYSINVDGVTQNVNDVTTAINLRESNREAGENYTIKSYDQATGIYSINGMNDNGNNVNVVGGFNANAKPNEALIIKHESYGQ